MDCNICGVMSGVPQKACCSEFSIVICMGTWPTFKTAAASHAGEIPSWPHTDPEFQHWPFNSGS